MQVKPGSGLIPQPLQQRPFLPPREERAPAPAPSAASGDAAPEPSKKILGYDVITWQKIIPLGAMFFCILFNYTILRDTKVRDRSFGHAAEAWTCMQGPLRGRAAPRLPL